MRGLLGIIARRYRSRGHGVHSPFAYAFITGTLVSRRGTGYYRYADIRDAAASRSEGQFAMLALRVACALSPGEIIVEGNSAALQAALTPAPARRPGAARLLIIAEDGHPAETLLTEAITRGDTIILHRCHREVAARLRAAMTAGMSFTSGNGTCIIVASPKLPLTHYTPAF